MKKHGLIMLLVLLLSFSALVTAEAPDRAPDSLENILNLTAVENLVVMAPVFGVIDFYVYSKPAGIFHPDNINKICVSDQAYDKAIYLWPAVKTVAVSYNGYELGTIFNITGEITAIYKTEFG